MILQAVRLLNRVSLEVVEGGLGPLAVLVRLGDPPGVGHDLVEGLEGLLFPSLLDEVLAEFYSSVMEE